MKVKPGDAAARTALAVARIAEGDTASGLASLESLARGDGVANADLALVAARVARGDAKGALAAVERLQRKLPAHPLADVLRARVLMGQDDAAGAGAAFQQALKKDPQSFDAVAGLAANDVRAKR